MRAGARLSVRCTFLSAEVFGGLIAVLLGEGAVWEVRVKRIPPLNPDRTAARNHR